MKIQIIIPVLEPPETLLLKTIPLLEHQTYKNSLLIINSGTWLFNMNHIAQIQISKSQFNHSNTRNLAQNYEADFYLFMTHDAIPYDELLLETLIKAFEDPEVVVAYARQIPCDDADTIERFTRTTNYPQTSSVKSKDDLPTLGIKTFFCSDSCAMYRASYFKAVNGFKKDLNTNEDMEFAARAILNNKKVAYVADARVYHSHHFTCKELWRRYREIGRFFARERWILEEVNQYSSTQSLGFEQMVKELKYVAKHNPRLLLRSILLSLTKYCAFKSSF